MALNMHTEKQELIQMIMDTEDPQLLEQLKAILQTRPGYANWFDELPSEVQESVEKGIAQSNKGEGADHQEVRIKYQKWLSK